MAEHGDWRKCQKEVKDFKQCMVEYERPKQVKGKSQHDASTSSKIDISFAYMVTKNDCQQHTESRSYTVKKIYITTLHQEVAVINLHVDVWHHITAKESDLIF